MSLSHAAFNALTEEVQLMARHGRHLRSRHLVRCLQARRLLEDPECEIHLDCLIQEHCDKKDTLVTTLLVHTIDFRPQA